MEINTDVNVDVVTGFSRCVLGWIAEIQTVVKGKRQLVCEVHFVLFLDIARTHETSLLTQKVSLRSGRSWEGGGSFSKTGVEDLAGAGGEEKVSTGREEEKVEKENTLQLTTM
jgi:hypothetical protein